MHVPPMPERMLIVEADPGVARLVETMLRDVGYATNRRPSLSPSTLQRVVDQLAPACVLIDETDRGKAWAVVAQLTARATPVPVVLCTRHPDAWQEAALDSAAPRGVGTCAAILSQPVNREELLAAVTFAIDYARRPPVRHMVAWHALAQAVLAG
jgi:CheY-like chemotaxis protein